MKTGTRGVDLQTFQLVTDPLPEAVLLVESCGLIRAANRRARLDLTPAGDDLAGRHLASLADGDGTDRLRDLLETCATAGAPWAARLCLRGSDGRSHAYSAFGHAVAVPPDGRGGPFVQLRLVEPERADGGSAPLRSRLDDLQRQVDELRRRLDDERRWRDRVDGLHRRLTEEIRLRHELAEEARRFEWLALHDGLTALGNRTLFRDRLERAVAVARREGGRVGVLVIDLDGFKRVNDTLGHHAGDALLCAVAQRLRAIVRGADTVARLGGDEFAVLMETGVDPAGVEAVAAKIAQALDLPFAVEGRTFELGASIGLALYPDHGGDAEAVLRRADAAMYRVKRAGGGQREDGQRRRNGDAFRQSLLM